MMVVIVVMAMVVIQTNPKMLKTLGASVLDDFHVYMMSVTVFAKGPRSPPEMPQAKNASFFWQMIFLVCIQVNMPCMDGMGNTVSYYNIHVYHISIYFLT